MVSNTSLINGSDFKGVMYTQKLCSGNSQWVEFDTG